MDNRQVGVETTWSAGAALNRELVEVLDGYLANLERGVAPDDSALLAAHPELAAELRPHLENLRLLQRATREISTGQDQPDEQVARHIGDYRIVREIGRGGMGIVYEAHQESLNRQVALKILPYGAVLDDRQIARFRTEAQAAAQLHHPHIVPVFAVGQEHNVYYYAMQYIEGESLEQVISGLRAQPDEPVAAQTEARGSDSTRDKFDSRTSAASSWSITHRDFFRSAARLGREAADALQHAHEYGIIHRDIKPSNLLVDRQGCLWVTDFGLARMQSDCHVTRTGDVVGTVRYMSPEQASGYTTLLDPRTDVYSLGVTLYELLTQQPAFPGDDRQQLLRAVITDDPVPPRKLNPNVPIDLETIVLAAMSKSRDERYPSARAFADDLARFLNDEPILARRPTLVDRGAKWARRHRSLVTAVVCAMMLGTVVSAVGIALLAREQSKTSAALAKAEQSALTAQQSFARAEQHFRQARSAVDQFGVRLADRLADIPGAESVRRELLVDTLGYYRQFVAHAGNDPQLRHELALAHFKCGVIASRLGAPSEALAEYKEAERLLRQLSAANPAVARYRSELAVTHNNLGLLRIAGGDPDAARDHYATAIGLQQRLVQESGNESFVTQLAESQANLGMLLDRLGDPQGAVNSLKAAVDSLRRLANSDQADAKHARNLAIASNNLSFVLRRLDANAAEVAAREAIAILARVTKQFPSDLQSQDDLALCYNNLAAIESQLGRVSEAISWHEQAVALQQRLLRKAPAVVRHRADLATTLNNLGVAYCRTGQDKEADAAFARARDLLSALADDYPDQLSYKLSLAALINNQALALAGANRHEAAAACYPQAIELEQACLASRPDAQVMREMLSKMYFNYSQSLQMLGRLAEALQATLARRQLWTGHGDRLIGVAAELAALAQADHDDEALAAKIDDEAVTTLRQAAAAGALVDASALADERFGRLRGDERVVELLSAAHEPQTGSQPVSAAIQNSNGLN